MGFFEDSFNVTKNLLDPAGMVTGDSWLRDEVNGPRPAPPGYTDPRHTFVQRKPKDKGVADLINPIYHTEEARKYGNTFDKAYEGLNQPLHDTNRDTVYVGGTRSLASAFADRVYQQTGSLPTEDQVRQFVAQSLTPAFAEKFILGMAPDQIDTIANEYIMGNPDSLTNPGTIGAAKSAEEQRILSLNGELDKVYAAGKNKFLEDTNDAYGAQKTGLVNDLAGQGMLTQPNSRISLDALEGAKNKSVGSGLNELAGKRAQGSLDLSTTIESLLQQNKDRALDAYKFGKTYSANRDDTYFNQGLQKKTLSLAEQLGKLTASGQKNDGTAGAMGGALNGGIMGGMMGGPPGALAGAIGGGALGYFGTKKR